VTSISPRSPEPGDAAGYSEHLAADAEFLGMDRLGGTNRFEFTVADHLSRLDGKLYGGTAIAASVAAAEQVSDRPALWMTTQFVSTTGLDSKISVQVEVLAPGRRTHQVSVTGTDAQGQVIFASLGATGHHAPDGLTGEFESRPEVGPPESGEVWSSPFIGMARGAGIDPSVLPLPAGVGFSRAVDLRHPEIRHHPDPGPGRVCVWARRTDGGPVTAAVAAYLADMVPMAVARAHGVVAMGTSLDNTIRIGTYVQSEWVLIDLRPHLAAGGYGHGIAHVWSETGQLMATASQTASMRPFDPDNLPWV
jgi:acyl-CoA thioesterase II